MGSNMTTSPQVSAKLRDTFRFRAGRGRLSVIALLSAAACTAYLGDPDERGGSRDVGGEIPETFTGPIQAVPAPSSRFIRLNHVQWENTVRDLLRRSEPLDISRSFVAEPLRSTFDTNGAILSVSFDLQRDYQRAAEQVAQQVAADSALLESLISNPSASPTDRARSFIESFGRRAWRRPLEEGEIQRCLALFARGSELLGSGDEFRDGIEMIVGYLLQSPHFLYRVEWSSDVVDERIPLSDYEIASKLSYALTNTMPDDVLLDAAEQGVLKTRDGLIAQAQRLLDSPAGAKTVENFHEQLLGMTEFTQISKNIDAYPAFGEGIAEDARREALRFVHHVVVERDQGLTELLTASYTFANDRIAGIYGIEAPGGGPDQFLRVDLDPTQRAGLLTQVGFLASHAEGVTPNIIMRGVNIAHRILCTHLPPPPDSVPPLPELTPDMTNRERVHELTKEPACAGCHAAYINPLGYALESLDGVGAFRDEENSLPIDTSASFQVDGEIVDVDGAVEMTQVIASSKQAHDCYAQHWAEYLYARPIHVGADEDSHLIEQAGWISKNAESAKNLIVQLLATDAFVTRAVGGADTLGEAP